jgi:DNA recombination protein RmuC
LDIVLIILGLLILAGIAWLALRRPDSSHLLIQQQIQAFQERMDRLSEKVDERLEQSSRAVSDRLDHAAKVFGEVQKGIGKITQTNEQILDISKNIASLEDMMRAPKFRGGMGELFLGDLLSQIIPPEHYTLQHRFGSGELVDAVVKLGEKLVPVDSKFPLENFKRISSSESELEKSAASKQFIRDVRKHVDSIAAKYIRPDEGTYDFALMYIPAENIYYEIIIKDNFADEDHPNLGYCLSKRVIPVSPNSFYAYLRTILLGLRGLKVEARAGEILADLNRLRDDFARFSASFELLGTHMENARKKYEESCKALGKLEVKLQQIETGKDKILTLSDS